MNGASILLEPGPPAHNIKILQLYPNVELFSEGDPPANTLFIQGRGAAGDPAALAGGDQLLLVDPGADAPTRFRLGGQVAVIFTGEAAALELPHIHTVPGGVAHIRVGEHFVDIYSQQHGNVIVLPALGIVCGGQFGSDVTLPLLAGGSDGSGELATCLLLAKLLKQHRLQLFIPRTGGLTANMALALDHLATDVSYLHSLQRVIVPLAQRQEPLARVHELAATLIPRERATPTAEAAHHTNVAQLYRNCTPLPG